MRVKKLSAAVVAALVTAGIGAAAPSASAAVTDPTGRYQVVTPSRIVDTRTGLGLPAGPVRANTTAAFQVTGRGGVPATGVQSVVVNITVVNPAATGWLVAYASGSPQPRTSTVNYPGGWTGATSATVPVGADGKMRKVESQAQVLIEPNESAVLPTSPSSPNPSRILPLGLLLGLLVGFGLAAVRQYNDTKVRRTEDVEEATGAGVLGILPKSEDLGSERGAADRNKSFHERESLRKLRTNLRFVDVDHQPRSIVITSAKQGEGKSTVASNLATVLAEAGERVVLVDADLRRSAVARAFDLDGSVGLSQVLAGTATLGDALQPSHTDGLEILAAGAVPPNPSELLGSHRMEQLIEQLAQEHFVILDAPPLLPVTDAALLTRSADGAVLVVAAAKTHKEEVERAVAALRAVDGKVLGAILNQVSTSKVDRIRYGDVEYGYTKSYTRDYVYEADGAGVTSRRELKGNRRRR